MKTTNIVSIIDPTEDLEVLARLCETDEMEERREFRRREHRREKRMKAGIDAAWITILCAACFLIGICIGGWSL